MESLALAAAVVFLTVLVSGPLAWLATRNGFIHIGAILGLFAMFVGFWFGVTLTTSIRFVGFGSALLGAYSFYRFYYHHFGARDE